MLKLFEENPKLAWFTTFVIAIGIFIISSIPSCNPYAAGPRVDHLAIIYHFFAFFFLGLFFMISATRGKHIEFFIPAITLAIFYSILDELHQYFVRGRFCSLGDIVTDSAGIFLAFIIYYIIIKCRS